MDPAQLFITRSRYFLQNEYRIKLRAAVEALPADALWWRPNAQSNSVGNLLAHLAGNVRQWIVSGVGGAANARDRSAEFAAVSGSDAAELLANLERALDEVDAVLANLSTADLTAMRTIQGRELSVLEAVYHVVEHFSMHMGQIIFIAKLHNPSGVKFYEDAGGLAKPLWPSLGSRP
jgi:uncharacterized damage-inducible protein DinB